jgi:hypothetical protein
MSWLTLEEIQADSGEPNILAIARHISAAHPELLKDTRPGPSMEALAGYWAAKHEGGVRIVREGDIRKSSMQGHGPSTSVWRTPISLTRDRGWDSRGAFSRQRPAGRSCARPPCCGDLWNPRWKISALAQAHEPQGRHDLAVPNPGRVTGRRWSLSIAISAFGSPPRGWGRSSKRPARGSLPESGRSGSPARRPARTAMCVSSASSIPE